MYVFFKDIYEGGYMISVFHIESRNRQVFQKIFFSTGGCLASYYLTAVNQ